MKAFTLIAGLAASATLAVAQLQFNADNNTFTCPIANGAYCAGDSLGTNIIVRCNNGVGQPGNCNDNLAGEPPQGVNYAPCFQSSETSGDAACSKNCVVYSPFNGTFTLPGCTPTYTASSTVASSTASKAAGSSSTVATTTSSASASSSTANTLIGYGGSSSSSKSVAASSSTTQGYGSNSTLTTYTTVSTPTISVKPILTTSPYGGSNARVSLTKSTYVAGGSSATKSSPGSSTTSARGGSSSSSTTPPLQAGAVANSASFLAVVGLVAAFFI